MLLHRGKRSWLGIPVLATRHLLCMRLQIQSCLVLIITTSYYGMQYSPEVETQSVWIAFSRIVQLKMHVAFQIRHHDSNLEHDSAASCEATGPGHSRHIERKLCLWPSRLHHTPLLSMKRYVPTLTNWGVFFTPNEWMMLGNQRKTIWLVDESNVGGRLDSFFLWETNGRASERASEADRTRPFHSISGGSDVRLEHPVRIGPDTWWSVQAPQVTETAGAYYVDDCSLYRSCKHNTGQPGGYPGTRRWAGGWLRVPRSHPTEWPATSPTRGKSFSARGHHTHTHGAASRYF